MEEPRMRLGDDDVRLEPVRTRADSRRITAVALSTRNGFWLNFCGAATLDKRVAAEGDALRAGVR
jgi:hypothetical protein